MPLPQTNVYAAISLMGLGRFGADRVHEQDFHLSHEFLAVMLGVQRPSVSVVAATLQRAGLISYRQGLVKVLNRKGLEGASCECYGLIRAQFDRLRS